MVRPANFARASETVADNSFQESVSNESFAAIGERARGEFDAFVSVLREHGVSVTVFEDTPEPVRPDAIFPNNWFSTHDDGTLVTYPCFWPQRRLERREDIIESLRSDYHVARHHDLTAWEGKGEFLESTGSLLLDRDHRIAYACLSQRCTPTAVERWCERMDYRSVCFHGLDLRDQTIYHTNVMMAIGTTHVIVCVDAVRVAAAKQSLIDAIAATGKTIVGLSLEQVDQFAGNALEVRTADGPVWIMSTAAYTALDEAQVAALLSPPGTRLLHSDLSTIERYGGGSARCMLGEIFLPDARTHSARPARSSTQA